MTDFNPLMGSLQNTARVQDQPGRPKQQQDRRPPSKPKSAPEQHDRFESQADEAEDKPEQESKKRRGAPPTPATGKDSDDSHIDLCG